jgi:hypothetical protein
MAHYVHFRSHGIMTVTVPQVEEMQAEERGLHIRRIFYTQRTHTIFKQRSGGSQM